MIVVLEITTQSNEQTDTFIEIRKKKDSVVLIKQSNNIKYLETNLQQPQATCSLYNIFRIFHRQLINSS